MEAEVKSTRRYRSRVRQEQAQRTRRRILTAARRLLIARGYGQVTMQAVAQEAEVAYQTVYALFGSKIRLALDVCEADLAHVGAVLTLAAQADAAGDPEGWLRTVATMTRRLYEPCADVLRFMRESGDADLLGRFKEIERSRWERLAPLASRVDVATERRAAAPGVDVVDVVWMLAGPETYEQLVLDRGWAPDRFEEWLGTALVELLTSPEGGPGGTALPRG